MEIDYNIGDTIYYCDESTFVSTAVIKEIIIKKDGLFAILLYKNGHCSSNIHSLNGLCLTRKEALQKYANNIRRAYEREVSIIDKALADLT